MPHPNRTVVGAVVTHEVKTLFQAHAQARGLTVSTLLSAVVSTWLDCTPEPNEASPLVPGALRQNHVRLRLTDHQYAELDRLAIARNWRRSTYLLHLLDAHLSGTPRIDATELAGLRALTGELADLGRNVNQIAHKLNSSLDNAHLASAVDFEAMSNVIVEARAQVNTIVRANLSYWRASPVETTEETDDEENNENNDEE